MAYAPSELTVMNGGFLESSQNIWLYRNTAGDSASTVKGNGYFSDGVKKGMKVGDIVTIYNLGGTAASTALYAVSDISTHPVTVTATVTLT